MAHMLASTYNGGRMSQKTDRRQILAISALAAILTLIPYLLAARLAPEGTRFSGFLINPLDGFSYLAKMKEGAEGSWLFTLPYAAQPGPGALLYIYHLFLGHVSRWTGLPLLTIYHAARVLGAFGAFVLAYLFLEWAVGDHLAARFAWVLVLVGSGFGWITTLLFHHPVSDMLIPESIPFLAVMSNSHFALALIGILAVTLAVVMPELRLRSRILTGAAAGLGLGAVLPFSAVGPAVVLGLWVLIAWFIRERDAHDDGLRSWRDQYLLPYLSFLLMLAPWAVYDLWLSKDHPILAAWNAQNQTPSPPPWEYAIGFGVVLLLAGFGLLHRETGGRGTRSKLIVWLLAGSVLLYVPVAFQRRLSMGLFFPLCALAAYGLLWFRDRGFRLPTLALIAVALAVPSNMLVLGASVAGVAGGDRELVHSNSELRAYAWLEENAAPGSLVLASARIGNRLPAFSDVRVLYGHPFETPDSEEMLEFVESLFRSPAAKEGLLQLESLGVGYVFYGPDERQLGQPAWIAALESAYRFEGIEIFRVPEP